MPTKLSPMEETLFQTWARAHRIEDHDDPKNIFDYRKIYKDTGGQIHPPGMLNGMAQAANSAVGDAQNGQGGDMIDPAMAAVEHEKNKTEAAHKAAERELKLKMHQEATMVKILLKKMELEHKTQQAEQDRQHKAQEAQMQHQLAMQQSESDRQTRLQEAQMGHQHEIERAQMGFQHDDQQAEVGHQREVEQAQLGHQHELESSQVGHQHDVESQQQEQALQPHHQLGRELFKRGMSGASGADPRV